MRTFIVSDLHGNGDVYDSIMGYLDNMSKNQDVELYINGDLIDRGLDSYRMLFDVIERVNGKGKVKIHYLGGNHELMMYNAMKKKKEGKPLSIFNDWILNGGRLLEEECLDSEYPIKPHNEVRNFLGDLDVYHLFDKTIMGKKLLVVHAQAPKRVSMECDLKIKDNNLRVKKVVWTREESELPFFKHRLGKEGYFTVIGHTPVNNRHGFFVSKDYINIDGGCAKYACGLFESDHVPLVEVLDGKLRILTFNHNNEIISEAVFDGKCIDYVFGRHEREEREKYLNHKYDDQARQYKRVIGSYLKE